MKKILLGLFFIILVASSVLAMTYKEANTLNKPIVLLLHKHGCSACQQFIPLYEQIAPKYLNKFNFVKEEISSSDLASKLNVEMVPTVFIIEPKTHAAKKIDDNCLWQKGCFEKALQDYK